MDIPKVDPKEPNYRGKYWKGLAGEDGRRQVPSDFGAIQESQELHTLVRLFDFNDFDKLDENGRSYLLAGAIYHGVMPMEYAKRSAIAELISSDPWRYAWNLLWILEQLKREPGYVRVKWRCYFSLAYADRDTLEKNIENIRLSADEKFLIEQAASNNILKAATLSAQNESKILQVIAEFKED